jgi:hypothetical protein
MNGRVYDYNVGRFLSVDPFVHGEAGSQGINPYSYVFNNPMAGTDPSGYNPDARASAFGLQMAVITGAISPEDARTIEAVISASPLDTGEHAGAADTGESIRIAVETGSITAAAAAMQKAAEAKANKKRRNNSSKSENGADNNQSGSSSSPEATTDIGSQRDTAKQEYEPTKRRVKLRKKVREKIDENTPTNENGDQLGPNGEVLKPESIDIGHKKGQEWRKRKKMHEEKGSTRKQVIEEENDPELYQKEDRSRNRSHKDEEKN